MIFGFFGFFGFLGFLGESGLDIGGVARDVVPALAQKEPNKNKNGAAKKEENDLDG